MSDEMPVTAMLTGGNLSGSWNAGPKDEQPVPALGESLYVREDVMNLRDKFIVEQGLFHEFVRWTNERA